MPIDGVLVESVDLRRLGGSARGNDVLGDRFDRCQEAPGEEEPGAFRREGARDRAADRSCGPVDHRDLVLQHHRLLPSVPWVHPVRQTPRRRQSGRPPTAQFATRPASIQEWTRRATDVRLDGAVTTDLISRARAGDGEAFRELTDSYRRELQVHCYRMLGSFQDAEDALQDTLLTAWRGLGGFEGRSSIRTWLYRIATNRCLDALRSASRRPAKEWDIAEYEPPEPTGLGEVVWLQPFPEPSSRLGSTGRSSPRPATSRPKRSPWPS